jgi:hypothetical protein
LHGLCPHSSHGDLGGPLHVSHPVSAVIAVTDAILKFIYMSAPTTMISTAINTDIRTDAVSPGKNTTNKTIPSNTTKRGHIYLTNPKKIIKPIICHTLRAGLTIVNRSITILFQSHFPTNATITIERRSARRVATSSI